MASNFKQSFVLRKKSLLLRKILVMLEETNGVDNQAFTGKNVLTSSGCSDNKLANGYICVYNSKCGSPVAIRWGLIKGGFGYG